MKLPMAPGSQDVPGYEEMMKKLFGPEAKMVVYVAAADDHTIVTAYTSKDLLLDCLKAVERPGTGLSGDKELAKTAAMLPAGAPWVGYWSPKGTIDFANQIVPAFAPPEVQFKLPEFPPTPPIGFAGETTPGGLRTYMVVPAAVVQAIGDFVVELKKMGTSEMPMEKATVEPLF